MIDWLIDWLDRVLRRIGNISAMQKLKQNKTLICYIDTMIIELEQCTKNPEAGP